MKINYNDFFWGDSSLKKTEIVYDKIILTVYNDVLKKNIFIECFKCVGITEFIVWDETIIDNIFLRELAVGQSPMLKKVKDIYGQTLLPFEKSFEGFFYELKVVLIGDISFSIICKNISFFDNIADIS